MSHRYYRKLHLVRERGVVELEVVDLTRRFRIADRRLLRGLAEEILRELGPPCEHCGDVGWESGVVWAGEPCPACRERPGG